VTKGKQEHYVKDDAALNDYLMSLAVQNAQLYVHPKAPPILGEALETLFRHYLGIMRLIKRLARRLPKEVLEAMIELPTLSDPESHEQLQTWLLQLQAHLERVGKHHYHLTVPDHDMTVKITQFEYGVETVYLLQTHFFKSPEYQSLVKLGQTVNSLLEPGAYIQRGEKQQSVERFQQAADWLTAEAKRGLHIQRYKGLGEMNPTQLWETTMNAETRHLLQVRIEDAIATDEIFTTLMGDQVEPRRDFIEKNALLVNNLDT